VTTGRRRGAGCLGSMSIELVLLTPVLLVLLLLVVAGGRMIEARGDVDGAAREAARAASTARDAASAADAGRAAARSRLRDGGMTCRRLDVDLDTSAFAPDGLVIATVACTVDLGDLTGLRLPATRVVSATFTETIDALRGAR